MKIAIASGKGGTGKTTLSTNLASYLSEEMEVVLTDLDVEEPNSGLFLNGEIVNKEDKFKMIQNGLRISVTLVEYARKRVSSMLYCNLEILFLYFPSFAIVVMRVQNFVRKMHYQ